MCTPHLLRDLHRPSRQRGSLATLHGLTTGRLFPSEQIYSPLSTFERATRNGQVVRTRTRKLSLGSSTKNAKREPSLESPCSTGLLGQDKWLCYTNNTMSSSTLDSATHTAKYCGRGLANRASDRPGRTPSREPSLESPCDWPPGPRRETR